MGKSKQSKRMSNMWASGAKKWQKVEKICESDITDSENEGVKMVYNLTEETDSDYSDVDPQFTLILCKPCASQAFLNPANSLIFIAWRMKADKRVRKKYTGSDPSTIWRHKRDERVFKGKAVVEKLPVPFSQSKQNLSLFRLCWWILKWRLKLTPKSTT